MLALTIRGRSNGLLLVTDEGKSFSAFFKEEDFAFERTEESKLIRHSDSPERYNDAKNQFWGEVAP